jgi:hypothetical protein
MGHIKIAEGELIVGNDFENTRAKKAAVFLADIFRPGITGSLDPHSGETVRVELARDVSPAVVELVCEAAGISVEKP